MAIIQGCPGIEVNIVSNGNALEEYLDDDPDYVHKRFSVPPYDSCSMSYVECTSDAEFGIQWKVTSAYCRAQVAPHSHLKFKILVDGHSQGASYPRVGPNMDPVSGRIDRTSERISDQEMATRKLVFKTVKKSVFSYKAACALI